MTSSWGFVCMFFLIINFKKRSLIVILHTFAVFFITKSFTRFQKHGVDSVVTVPRAEFNPCDSWRSRRLHHICGSSMRR